MAQAHDRRAPARRVPLRLVGVEQESEPFFYVQPPLLREDLVPVGWGASNMAVRDAAGAWWLHLCDAAECELSPFACDHPQWPPRPLRVPPRPADGREVPLVVDLR